RPLQHYVKFFGDLPYPFLNDTRLNPWRQPEGHPGGGPLPKAVVPGGKPAQRAIERVETGRRLAVDIRQPAQNCPPEAEDPLRRSRVRPGRVSQPTLDPCLERDRALVTKDDRIPAARLADDQRVRRRVVVAQPGRP